MNDDNESGSSKSFVVRTTSEEVGAFWVAVEAARDAEKQEQEKAICNKE